MILNIVMFRKWMFIHQGWWIIIKIIIKNFTLMIWWFCCTAESRSTFFSWQREKSVVSNAMTYWPVGPVKRNNCGSAVITIMLEFDKNSSESRSLIEEHRELLFSLICFFRQKQPNKRDFVLPPLSTQVPSLGFFMSHKPRIVSQDTNKSVFFPFHLCRKIIKKGVLNCVQADSSVQ